MWWNQRVGEGGKEYNDVGKMFFDGVETVSIVLWSDHEVVVQDHSGQACTHSTLTFNFQVGRQGTFVVGTIEVIVEQ